MSRMLCAISCKVREYVVLDAISYFCARLVFFHGLSALALCCENSFVFVPEPWILWFGLLCYLLRGRYMLFSSLWKGILAIHSMQLCYA